MLDKLLTQARAYGANANRQMDWTLEPLIPIVTKKQPFFVQAGSEDAIRQAIAWAERQGLNIVIRTSPAAAVATADLLKAKNVPVILSNDPHDAAGRRYVSCGDVSGRGPAGQGGRAVRVLERRLRQRRG